MLQPALGDRVVRVVRLARDDERIRRLAVGAVAADSNTVDGVLQETVVRATVRIVAVGAGEVCPTGTEEPAPHIGAVAAFRSMPCDDVVVVPAMESKPPPLSGAPKSTRSRTPPRRHRCCCPQAPTAPEGPQSRYRPGRWSTHREPRRRGRRSRTPSCSPPRTRARRSRAGRRSVGPAHRCERRVCPVATGARICVVHIPTVGAEVGKRSADEQQAHGQGQRKDNANSLHHLHLPG